MIKVYKTEHFYFKNISIKFYCQIEINYFCSFEKESNISKQLTQTHIETKN